MPFESPATELNFERAQQVAQKPTHLRHRRQQPAGAAKQAKQAVQFDIWVVSGAISFYCGESYHESYLNIFTDILNSSKKSFVYITN